MLFREVHESVLDNGLKVLVVEDPSSPTASLQLFYRVGSRHEPSACTGISHVLEHMMFRGTARFPAGMFDRVVQENGMVSNAYTSHDFTCYYENMAADRLEVAMELEADRMQGLLLDEETFQTEMSVIREERRETVEDPPFGLLSEAVQAAVFQHHPYRRPVIGWMSDLENLTLEDVRAYYGNTYRPNRALLVVVGDVERQGVLDLARRFFGAVARGPEPSERAVVEPPQQGERTVACAKEVRLPGLLVCYRTPSGRDRDALALNVAEFILLHGRSSRLYQELIYRRQLATGLAGGFSLRIDPSIFSFRATARPGVELAELRTALYQVLEDLALHPPGEAELSRARQALETDFVFAQESHFGLGQDLGQDECRGSWRTALTYLDDHLSVTSEEIQAAAARTFAESNRTAGFLLPVDQAPGGAAEAADAPSGSAHEAPGRSGRWTGSPGAAL